jgi:Zinc carboxypeptidase
VDVVFGAPSRRAATQAATLVLGLAAVLLMLFCAGAPVAGAWPANKQCPTENGGSYSVEGYISPEEVDQAVASLARTSDAVTTQVIGHSNRGRPIHAVRMGTGDQVVFLQGGIHGNEPTGTKALLHLLSTLANGSERSREIRDAVTIVAVPQLNPDGMAWYQRNNSQTWEEVVEEFPQLAAAPAPAFNYELPGPRFWADPRVSGFDLNRDFNPDFSYVPQPAHFPGSGAVRGWYITPESRASRDLYASLEQEFGTVDVFIDLHNQAPCSTGGPEMPDDLTPMSLSAQFLTDPAAHGAGTLYPKFDYDASRRANVAAWDAVTRGASTFSKVTRYPQNLTLAGSGTSAYQLHGSAVVLMEAGRQRNINPQKHNGFTATLHELAMAGVIDAVADSTLDDIDPERYEDIPIRD